MPFANNDGVRIHYEAEGEGPPVILLHGSTQSLKQWHQYGYVDELRSSFRIVTMDARGHGGSDKPHDPAAYTAASMALDVVAVMDALGLPNAAYFGYSMGGRIGYRLAELAPHRLTALIIGGAYPHGGLSPDMEDNLSKLRAGGLEAMAAGRSTPESRASALENDAKAIEALFVGTSAWQDVPAEIIVRLPIPMLFFAGDLDYRYARVKQLADAVPTAVFYTVLGQDHSPAMRRSDLVLPFLTDFLAIAFGTTEAR